VLLALASAIALHEELKRCRAALGDIEILIYEAWEYDRR